MKSRLVVLLLVLTLVLVGCGSQTSETQEPVVVETPAQENSEELEENEDEKILEKIDIQVGALRGPTGMGMVQMMDRADKGLADMNYHFELVGSPDEMVGKIINGELDIAAVPTNMALLLHNRTEGAVQLAAVNTLGVLYLVENGDTIQSMEDLRGQTVNTSGKGASPDFVFRHLLESNHLIVDEDVQLDYNLQHADLAAALVEGDVEMALLPQPHVTSALMRNSDLRVALDITEEWAKIHGAGSELAMGVIIVQKEFADNHPEALEAFLKEYEASVEFVNQEVDDAAELIAHYGILPQAGIAKASIPLSNIVFIDAMAARERLDAFYRILYDFEPQSIGGKLADDAFYYKR